MGRRNVPDEEADLKKEKTLSEGSEESTEIPEGPGEKEEPEKPEDPFKDMVEFIAPVSEGEKGDMIIGVNGHIYTIQRGHKVMVPRCVKEVYEQAERQKYESIRYQDKAQEGMNGL